MIDVQHVYPSDSGYVFLGILAVDDFLDLQEDEGGVGVGADPLGPDGDLFHGGVFEVLVVLGGSV